MKQSITCGLRGDTGSVASFVIRGGDGHSPAAPGVIGVRISHGQLGDESLVHGIEEVSCDVPFEGLDGTPLVHIVNELVPITGQLLGNTCPCSMA